jgi:hypothetical protein
MSTFYSNSVNTAAQGVSLNDTRRKFDFGDRVAELAPQQSPFFTYLSKVAKKPTNDPVFKFLEQRHQWQRRNFVVDTEETSAAMATSGLATSQALLTDMEVQSGYDDYGKVLSANRNAVPYLLVGQIIVIECDYAADGTTFGGSSTHRVTGRVTEVNNPTADTNIDVTPIQLTLASSGAVVDPVNTAKIRILAGARAQIIGSAFAEGTDTPTSWEDKLFDREGYCQIFKTAMNIFSGTSQATEYRGIKNEFQRIWQEKLMEHKMDIEHGMLFGIGESSFEATAGSAPIRKTWGILPYAEQYGKHYAMTYASSGYDAFLDAMEDFFAPESGNSGNKLVLASRKVITYLNKLGNGSFLNNTVGSSQYNLDVQSVKGAFGHQVTMVNTIFGNLHFVAEPLLRGVFEDYCVAVDMKNVAYRPLVGNGISRDTFIETNVQDNGVDGRQDQVITEGGLEISLPETHAVMKFS